MFLPPNNGYPVPLAVVTWQWVETATLGGNATGQGANPKLQPATQEPGWNGNTGQGHF
jgi:hypothetical protein